MRISSPQHAFTLIELLICISMIGLVAGAGFMLIIGLDDSHARLEERLESEAASDRALALWRDDVAAAQAVEIESAGTILRLRRLDETGTEIEVTYWLDDVGRLIRTAGAAGAAGVERALASGIEAFQCARVGGGLRIEWVSTYDDGIQTWRWRQEALATPLNAAPIGAQS